MPHLLSFWPLLTHLYLERNYVTKITGVSSMAGRDVTVMLSVAGNPFDCSERSVCWVGGGLLLAGSVRWAVNFSNVLIFNSDLRKMKCSGPAHLQGKTFYDMCKYFDVHQIY